MGYTGLGNHASSICMVQIDIIRFGPFDDGEGKGDLWDFGFMSLFLIFKCLSLFRVVLMIGSHCMFPPVHVQVAVS